MSLATQIGSLVTRIGTEFKAIRTIISGTATGDASGLATTSTNLVGAINEVRTTALSGGAAASETVAGIAEIATQTESNTGTDDARMVTPLKLQTRMAAYAQPLDSDLTAIAALTTTAFGRALLALVDGTALAGQVAASTPTLSGVVELATNAETITGTDAVRAVTPAGDAAALAAYAQPLDSDLTAIAALTTTAYGRAFLSLANQAGLMALLSTGTTAAAGILQLATNTEATTGTDTAKATTAAGVKAAIDQRIASDGTLGGGSPSSTNAPSQSAVQTYVAARIAALDVFAYKGVIDASTNPNYPASNAGDVYRISVAGKIGGASGPNVEPGDMLFALTDGSAAGTQAAVGANWDIVQINIDGAVVGPASAVSGDFATFSGTGGKVIQDSGISLDTDGTLTANSDTKIASQKAVKTYAQPKDTELTALASTTSAADTVPYFTGAGTAGTTPLTAAGRALIDDADAAAQRTTLDVPSNTQVGDTTTDFVAAFNTAIA